MCEKWASTPGEKVVRETMDRKANDTAKLRKDDLLLSIENRCLSTSKLKFPELPSFSTRPDILSQSLGLPLLQLASTNKAGHLLLPDTLDLVRDLQAIQLASERSDLIGVDLALHQVNVVQHRVDLGGARIASSEVVGILDGALEHTLVLLDRVLGRLLGLLRALPIKLGLLLSLLGSLLLGLLLGLGLLSGLLLGRLALVLLLVLLRVRLLAEALDALVAGHDVVDKLSQARVVLGLSLLARVGVLALHVALLVAVLVVVGHVLVEVFEAAPRVEVVPEVVEVLDQLLGAADVAKRRHGRLLAEAALGLEDLAPALVEVDAALLELLLGWGLDLGAFVDRVELPALDGVEEHLGGLLDALEEVVVFGAAAGGFLVRVVLEDLLAVGALDLLLGGLEAVLG